MGTQLPRLLGAALAQVPAAWLLAGIAVALFGLVPRWSAAAWGALGRRSLVLTWSARPCGCATGSLDISPFTHVPKLPGGTFTATPLLWLARVAVALIAAGLAGLRRRDIT